MDSMDIKNIMSGRKENGLKTITRDFVLRNESNGEQKTKEMKKYFTKANCINTGLKKKMSSLLNEIMSTENSNMNTSGYMKTLSSSPQRQQLNTSGYNTVFTDANNLSGFCSSGLRNSNENIFATKSSNNNNNNLQRAKSDIHIMSEQKKNEKKKETKFNLPERMKNTFLEKGIVRNKDQFKSLKSSLSLLSNGSNVDSGKRPCKYTNWLKEEIKNDSNGDNFFKPSLYGKKNNNEQISTSIKRLNARLDLISI